MDDGSVRVDTQQGRTQAGRLRQYVWLMGVVLVLALILTVTSVSADAVNVPPILAGLLQIANTNTTRYVKPGAMGDCNSWADACNLQTALGMVESGDQVWVAEGIYYPGTVVSDTFMLKNGIELYGGFPAGGGDWDQRDWNAYPTILSGDIDHNDLTDGGVVTDPVNIKGTNSNHVVTGKSLTSAKLDGFTITAGKAAVYPGIGGGLYNDGSSITLTNVIIMGNQAGEGGGIYNNGSVTLTNVIFNKNSGGGLYNSHGSVSLTNVTFSYNNANDGGGLVNLLGQAVLTEVNFTGNNAYEHGGGMQNDQGSATLTNVTFSGNTGSYGGGMSNLAGSVQLRNVTFASNQSDGLGGGMYMAFGITALTSITFTDNQANEFGGGIYIYYGTTTLTNVTFSDNYAPVGGGLRNIASNPTLINVTFFENIASQYGGGIYNEEYHGVGSHPTLINSILWGNSPDQIYNDELSSTTITYSDIQDGWEGEGNIDLNPQLSALKKNGGFTPTHALEEGSPAIDAGRQEGCPLTDQRGYLRPFDGDGDGVANCDMGAYEYWFFPYEVYLPAVEAGLHQSFCSAVDEIPERECESLVALYNSTGGDNWAVHTNWLVTNTPSTWFGVTVWDGHVTQIDLHDNQLNGVIPPELSNLTSLSLLSLCMNQLSGVIPPELGNMTSLWSLKLYGNQLTGTIPASLGNLINLFDLDLSSNHLTGSIPAKLKNLHNLGYLMLGNNQLSGNIPAVLGNLTALEQLYLGENQLSGNIPPELGNMAALKWIVLAQNHLSGSLPPELGNLTNLQVLNLYSNQLSGSIPASLGSLSSLEMLDLNFNQISGSIPLSFTNLSRLDYFHFNNTILCEPDTPDYLVWKATVLDYHGTGVICEG